MPESCTLHVNATCAQGECCENCQIKMAAVMCRDRVNECDLPEYCTGRSNEVCVLCEYFCNIIKDFQFESFKSKQLLRHFLTDYNNIMVFLEFDLFCIDLCYYEMTDTIQILTAFECEA